MNTDLIAYYHSRANEYESLYSKPERQDDLKLATDILQNTFLNKNIIEIACGTGYWTERIAKTASSILATDINESVIAIARQKDYGNADVQFAIADLYNYADSKTYEGLFGGFIWSHIPVQELKGFLQKMNQLVDPNGMVVFMDNTFVGGSNHPITHTDEYGNTYQTRKLKDGSEHLVMKNFAEEGFMREQLKGIGREVEIIRLEYYWVLRYKAVGTGG